MKKTLQKVGVVLGAVGAMLGLGVATFHQVTAAGTAVATSGTVNAVSSASITVKPATGAAVVYVLNTKTKFTGRSSEGESVGLISVGDSVTVRGTSVSTTVTDVQPPVTVVTRTATTVQDLSIWRAHAAGTLNNLDLANTSFTVTAYKSIPELRVSAQYTFGNKGNTQTKIRQTTTTRTGNRSVSVTNTKAWTDLVNGQAVTVNGLWNVTKETMTDSSIIMPTITIKK